MLNTFWRDITTGSNIITFGYMNVVEIGWSEYC